MIKSHKIVDSKMLMKRINCQKCNYPVKTCVCDYLTNKVANLTKVVILQHPDEVNLAKNTVRLLQLQLVDIEVVVGETQKDFQKLIERLPTSNTALLYPGDEAIDVNQCHKLTTPLSHLLVIDGTWKKTRKIVALNPWLHSLQKVSFDLVPDNQYKIRKAKQPYSLSTLEAVSHFLYVVEGCDKRPFLDLLKGMIKQQTKLMPDHVKVRYFED